MPGLASPLTLRLLFAAALLAGSLLAAPALRAQSPDAGVPPSVDAGLDAGGSPATPSPEEEADADAGPAPSTGQAAPVDPNALTPPSLLTFVPATYPPEAYEAKLEAAVVLKIDIGADGFVRDAQVTEPAGHGFDEAAQSAVLRFVFEPAKKGDRPIPARILYRYDFTWQPPPEAQIEAPSIGELELEVRSARDDAPLDGVEVRLSLPENPEFGRTANTDVQGRARFDELAPGAYAVALFSEGYDDETSTEEVVAGEVTSLRYRMTVETLSEGYGAQARVEAPAREVTRRTIERSVLTRVAGTRGDALRTIQLLPGVARPPFGLGLVIIRGSAPEDSAVLLDGTQVPLLYHFGGLTSFYASRALERIDFYPGNFSARFGRRTGGIVDVEVRDPRTDGYHGVLDTNLPLDTSLLIEGPITDKSAFLVSGRRSYLGEVLNLTIPEGTFDAFSAPVYYDAQALVTYRPTPRDRIRYLGYLSGDGIEVLFSDVPPDDPSIRQIEANLAFQRLQLEWNHRYSDDLTHDVRLSYGRNPTDVVLGPDTYFKLMVHDVTLRAEWRYQISPKATVTVGTDSIFGRFRIDYSGPPPLADEGNPSADTASSEPTYRLDGYADPTYNPGFYVESDLRPVEDWQLILGLRVDYDGYIRESWFDPRLTVIHQLTDKATLKAGVGVYSQPPQVQETAAAVGGNPQLEPIRSVHYGVGAEYLFNEVFSATADAFYKNIYDNVVGAAEGEGPPNFTNDGVGRIYGLELSGRAKGGERFFGFFSYTLMKSERNDRHEGYRPFDFDQRHILSMSGTYRFGNGWELGGTFRVVTGSPTTPIDEGTAVNNLDGVRFQDPDYAAINSARVPTFHRLDVRAERKWTFSSWALAAYLDIQNVYNAKNPEGTSYNFDFTESGPVRGLPIIPVLGLRGEM